MAPDGKTRRRFERHLLEAVQLAGARYADLSRKHSQALWEACAAEGGRGNLLLARCAQLQPARDEALEQYTVALKRFSELVLSRKLPEDLRSQTGPQTPSPSWAGEYERRLFSRYREAAEVLADASKLMADANVNGIPEGFDRLWEQCDQAWHSCAGLRDEIFARVKPE